MITVRVKTMDDSVFTVMCDQEDTVRALKAAVQAETGVGPELQRLIYRGKLMHNDSTVASYGIDDGHVIHLVARSGFLASFPCACEQQLLIVIAYSPARYPV